MSHPLQDKLHGGTANGPGNTTPIVIPVCFIDSGWPQSVSTAPWRTRFELALRGTWSRATFLDFTGFGTCPGTSAVPTMRVLFTYSAAQTGDSPAGAQFLSTTGNSVRLLFTENIGFHRFRYLAVHEVGHFLGFQHEQDLALGPTRCRGGTAPFGWPSGTSFNEDFDERSIMMSHNTPPTCANFHSNNRGYLSPSDITGVRRAYGFRPARANGDAFGRVALGGQIPGVADGIADLGTYSSGTGVWHWGGLTGDFNPPNVTLGGISNDVPLLADFDGDGLSDPAIYRPSDCNGSGCLWLISIKGVVNQIRWGAPGDWPLVFDTNGDGAFSPATYRPSIGHWYFHAGFGPSSDSGGGILGDSNDVPVPADYDGDGRTDPAVWDPATGNWTIGRDNGLYNVMNFGTTGDVPVPMDYTGEGIARPSVWRPTSGVWFFVEKSPLFNATLTNGLYEFAGAPNDIPIPGSYRGLNIAEPRLFRPSTGRVVTATGETTAIGQAGDVPLPLNRFRTAAP